MTNNLIKFVAMAVIMTAPLGILGIVGMMNQGAYADSCASSAANTNPGGTASSASGTSVVNVGGLDHEKCGSASSAGAFGTAAAAGDGAQCDVGLFGPRDSGIACARAN
jgi:hypothetical protein